VAEPLPDAVRWLLVGSLASAIFSVALIARTLEIARAMPKVYRAAEAFLLVGGILCLGVGLTDWGAKTSLTAMVVLLLAPVASGMYVWLRYTDWNSFEPG
jgi:hypothetical protein